MKSFFIIKKNLPHTVDEKFLVQEIEMKNDIMKQMNLTGLNLDDFNFYNESTNTDNQYINAYHNAIFEVYFPRVKEKNELVYYPEPKIIENNNSTIYVNQWELVNIQDASSILYISDDSDPEESQRVLFIFKS